MVNNPLCLVSTAFEERFAQWPLRLKIASLEDRFALGLQSAEGGWS